MDIAYEQNVQEKKKSLRSGFTLIELVIVLTIIGVLSVVIVPNLFRYFKSSRFTKTETTLNTLRSAITSYYAAVGKYPTSLRDLIKKPADVPVKKWVAAFIESDEVPRDAWGNEFVYKLTPKGAHPYDLYSFGEAGPGGSAEDQVSVWG